MSQNWQVEELLLQSRQPGSRVQILDNYTRVSVLIFCSYNGNNSTVYVHGAASWTESDHLGKDPRTVPGVEQDKIQQHWMWQHCCQVQLFLTRPLFPTRLQNPWWWSVFTHWFSHSPPHIHWTSTVGWFCAKPCKHPPLEAQYQTAHWQSSGSGLGTYCFLCLKSSSCNFKARFLTILSLLECYASREIFTKCLT